MDIAQQADAMASGLAALASTASEREIVAAIGRQAIDRAFGHGARS